MQGGKFVVAEHVAGNGQARRHAHHAHQRAQGQRQHGGGGLKRGFGQGVTEEIGVLVPQLLVQHIDHHATAGRAQRLFGQGAVARVNVRVQGLGQQNRRARVCAQVLFHGGKAKVGGVVVLKGRRAVDHRVQIAKLLHHVGQQLAHGHFVA